MKTRRLSRKRLPVSVVSDLESDAFPQEPNNNEQDGLNELQVGQHTAHNICTELRLVREELAGIRNGLQMVIAKWCMQTIPTPRIEKEIAGIPEEQEKQPAGMSFGATYVRQFYPDRVSVWEFIRLFFNAKQEGLIALELVCCMQFQSWPARIGLDFNREVSDAVLEQYPNLNGPNASESLATMEYMLVEFFNAYKSQRYAWVKYQHLEPFEKVLQLWDMAKAGVLTTEKRDPMYLELCALKKDEETNSQNELCIRRWPPSSGKKKTRERARERVTKKSKIDDVVRGDNFEIKETTKCDQNTELVFSATPDEGPM